MVDRLKRKCVCNAFAFRSENAEKEKQINKTKVTTSNREGIDVWHNYDASSFWRDLCVSSV